MIFQRKRISCALLLALLLVTTVVLSACEVNAFSTESADKEYDFSVYFGNTDDSIQISNLISKYEEEKGVVVEPVFAESIGNSTDSLERMINKNNPVSAFLISEGPNFDNMKNKGYVANLSALTKANDVIMVDGNRLLWSTSGYGLAVDQRMLCRLFALENSDEIIANIRAATFAEWKDFIEKLEQYIFSDVLSSVTFGGVEYSFVEEKSNSLKKLNGAYALSGYESRFTGEYLINNIFENTNTNPMEPLISAYIESLDFVTQHLSGKFAPGIRGESFIIEEYYGATETESMFLEGNALFTILDTDSYDRLAKENNDKATNIVLLPIKMPLVENGIEREDNNQKIVTVHTQSLCINNSLSREKKLEVLEFLNWIAKQKAIEENSLQRSVRSYFVNGNYLDDYSLDEKTSYFLNRAFSANEGIKPWLSDNNWTDEEKESLRNHLYDAWLS